ncbi:hypothetical protein JCM18899A_23620 [Nocardioides sp. AN3]
MNAATAWLFIVGSACFVLGSVPGYVSLVGPTADGITFFVGSIFFTLASFAQLVQAQSPAMTSVDERRQHVRAPVRLAAWLPHDRNWLAAATQFPGTLFFNVTTFAALHASLDVAEQDHQVWRPDFFGSILFLVASAFALAALGGAALTWAARSLPWRIAWLNMVGSVLFMASALGSYVLPDGELVSETVDVVGTGLGAACFLWGAALMLPAWREAVVRTRISDA